MKTLIHNIRIITEKEILLNHKIVFDDDIIEGIFYENESIENIDNLIDGHHCYLSAGWIDLHVHGGGGSDFMDDDPQRFKVITQKHMIHGLTSMLATTLAGRNEEVLSLLRELPDENDDTCGTKIIGVHMEGPYFALEQKGAQDSRFIRNPDLDEIKMFLNESSRIKRWSIAPELPLAHESAQLLNNHNILVSIAHTNADANEILLAEEKGFRCVTHLYSAMTSIYKKNGIRHAGGVEGTFLSQNLSAELIADGVHLPKEIIKLSFKILGSDRIILTTDAMRAAGLNTKTSILGSLKYGQPVIIKDSVAKLPDESSLAGSVATMDRLVKTCLESGINLVDTIKSITFNPAQLIYRQDLGQLKPKAKADAVMFNDDIDIIRVFVNGQCRYERGNYD